MPDDNEPKKKSTLEIGNWRETFDGKIQVRAIITRTVGRGKDPTKLVTHKQKWKTVTKIVSEHPRGKARQIAESLLAMIQTDLDNLDMPEHLLPPVIIPGISSEGPEPDQVPLVPSGVPEVKEKGSPNPPSKEKKEPEPAEGIPSPDRSSGTQRPAAEGIQEVQDHGVPESIIESIPERISKVKDMSLDKMLSRVREIRTESLTWRDRVQT